MQQTTPDLPFELDDENPTPGVGYGRDILVVDDNQTNLIAIEAALSPLGRKLVKRWRACSSRTSR